MTYSIDFRKRVIRVQKDEGLTFKQTAEHFRIGIASLTRWHKNPKPIATRKRPAIKIDMEKLTEDVQQIS
jgi:transposase